MLLKFKMRFSRIYISKLNRLVYNNSQCPFFLNYNLSVFLCLYLFVYLNHTQWYIREHKKYNSLENKQ